MKTVMSEVLVAKSDTKNYRVKDLISLIEKMNAELESCGSQNESLRQEVNEILSLPRSPVDKD